MGKSQRRKGHDWERRIVRWLNQFDGVEAERNLTETREGNSGDVLVEWRSSRRLKSALILIEAKHRKRVSPWKALDEARDAAVSRSNCVGVAIVKETHGDTEVWIDIIDLPWLMRESMAKELPGEVRRKHAANDVAFVCTPEDFGYLLSRQRISP